MATVKLGIHIPDDTSSVPDTALKLVIELSKTSGMVFETAKELQEYLMETQATPNRSEVVANAKNLGLLDAISSGLCLSESGLALAQLREDSRGDLLHFLLYTGWSAQRPAEFLQSWGYRCVCDQYWATGVVELTSDYLDRQVGEVISIAQTTFAELSVGAFDEISFSRKSLRGAHNWLESLQPPVIDTKTRIFKRRSFCPPELIVMAIGHVLSTEANATGIDILLSGPKREAIAKICLLEPDMLDRALDWAMPIFSNIIAQGTTAGFYGRFIRLHRLPTLRDVIR